MPYLALPHRWYCEFVRTGDGCTRVDRDRIEWALKWRAPDSLQNRCTGRSESVSILLKALLRAWDKGNSTQQRKSVYDSSNIRSPLLLEFPGEQFDGNRRSLRQFSTW